jgi:L,D-peptidoglycan transpeptidase YkuD (ErfK/YbiS/YcfS/YnhG family)
LVQFGAIVVPAAIGRSGRTVLKREGDGATPIASMKLLFGFRRGERPSRLQTLLPIRRIRKDMLWCDQPDDPNYNRLAKSPFRPSHEEMKRGDGLYDVCLVMDWNVTSRARNRGSAIFFHLIKPGYEPTAGCVAIHPRDMRRLLPFIRRGTVVRVV